MARLLFSAKAGGSSAGSYTSLNIAKHVGDIESVVDENRSALKVLTSVNSLQFMDQKHGNTVVVIDEITDEVPSADALVTNIKSLGLVVMVADCLPILIDGGDVIGAVHVGRKGMANGIIEATIKQMQNRGAQKLNATIGAGICGSCYEVDSDMYREIIKLFPEADGGFRKLDIRKSATKQLEFLGVEVTNITECTLENGKYYSYRRNNTTGRQCGVISL